MRDIQPGEELSYDYALQVDEPLTKEIEQESPCYCGAASCRGALARGGIAQPRQRRGNISRNDRLIEWFNKQTGLIKGRYINYENLQSSFPRLGGQRGLGGNSGSRFPSRKRWIAGCFRPSEGRSSRLSLRVTLLHQWAHDFAVAALRIQPYATKSDGISATVHQFKRVA